MPPQNKRRHRRIPSRDISGHVVLEGVLVGAALPIENISLGGVFIRTNHPLPVGTPVELELGMRGVGGTLLLSGRVVSLLTPLRGKTESARIAGMGVAFEAHSGPSTERLRVLLTEAARRATAHAPAAAPVPAAPARRPDGESLSLAAQTAYCPVAVPESMQETRRACFDFSGASLRSDGPAAVAPERPAAPGGGTLPELRPGMESGELPVVEGRPLGLEAGGVQESARLLVQVQGLLMDLGQAHSSLAAQARELTRLEEELERSRQELARRAERIRALEGRLSGVHPS